MFRRQSLSLYLSFDYILYIYLVFISKPDFIKTNTFYQRQELIKVIHKFIDYINDT